MATEVIMPALGMAQDTGKVVRWLKAEGDEVLEGEPLLEIETDKATVEVEAEASGILGSVTAREGDEVPVGETIAQILAPGETVETPTPAAHEVEPEGTAAPTPIEASPVAARIAAEHGIDLYEIKPAGGRVQKSDVLAYLDTREDRPAAEAVTPRLPAASPKARRLARERGIDVASLDGSGPEGAILAADVLSVEAPAEAPPAAVPAEEEMLPVSRVWRIMAERTIQSWTDVPHFYLLREVRADRLIAWRESVQRRLKENVSYTDLLVKLVAAALGTHPRLNASWDEDGIRRNDAINVGLAVAVEDGLVVPVIHHADTLSLNEIAMRRDALLARAQAGTLRPADISGGTFTISNLGMYGIDAFHAIVNPPQAAILAVGRIAERVVPVDGTPAVRPMMVLTLSCDHRVVDGARGAQFLELLVDLIEDPLALLD